MLHKKHRWSSLLALLTLLSVHCSSAPKKTPKPQTTHATWIDTDISATEKNRDIDDALALLLAFRSPELSLRGISTIFGNIPLERVTPIAQSVTERFGPRDLKVYAGASNADALGQETPASRALTAALRKESLHIIALGPLTNIATVLKNHPDLKGNITQVIAIGGRRPQTRLTTGTENTRSHRDFNFEMDPAAFQALFNVGVPVVLIPFELSSQIWLSEEDFKPLAHGGAAGQWIRPLAHDGVKLWKKLFNVEGINPFEATAVGYAIQPEGMDCESQPVQIQSLPDDEERDSKRTRRHKAYLLAAPDLETPDHVLYCTGMRSGFKKELLQKLASP